MNIEAFLAAQLWLRPLPAQAWPSWTTTPAVAVARRGARDPDRDTITAGTGVNIHNDGLEGSGSVVLLPWARCCFVLENRPSTTAAAGVTKRSSSSGSSSSSSSNGRNANKRSRTLYLSTTRRGASDDKSHGDGGSSTTNKGIPDAEVNSAPGAREAHLRGGRPLGQSRGDPISCDGFQQDNSGTVRPPRGKGRGEGCPITTSTPTESALACEFDFGLAIARPTPPREGHAIPCGGAGGGHVPPIEEGECGGGTLLLRIEGKVYEAEHTLIQSIAYPRGGGSGGNGGAGAGNRRGPNDESGAAKPATSPVDGDSADSNRGRVDEHGRGPMAAARASPPPTRPPTASALAGGNGKAGASNGDGAAGAGRGGSAWASDGLQEGAGRRGQVDSMEGAFGAAIGGGDGRGDRVGAAAAAVEAETTQQKRRSGAGTPFCGLFFPGVLLKFWIGERTPARDGGDARAEAVTKMQGVVSEMLARLSPDRSCHRATSASGTSPQGLECLCRSAVVEGEDTGFRRQYEAWDEFVYGSHVLFQESYRRPQQCAPDLLQQGGHGGGGRAAAGSVVRATCSDLEGIDAPTLCESIGNDSARLGGGGLSDVGRTRALTVLAECFRQASLPCQVSLVAQRRLDAASASAGRELEDALDRAFPLDLSQGTDSSSRETTASELKASLRRVQAARKSALALAILPASTVLDESSGDTFA